MMKEMFEWELRTDIGTRAEQQDFACVSTKEDMLFAVLCDGMGGMSGGASAARSATDAFVRGFETENIQHVPSFLIRTVERVNALVASLPVAGMQGAHAGTTVVSVIVKDGQLYWLSVGDSRLYILRNGRLTQVTKDHNYFLVLDDLLENRRITKENYVEQSARGNALISYLGMPKLDRIDINVEPLPLQSGDVLLLSSDGVYHTLGEEILRTQMQEQDAADRLMSLIRCSRQEQQDNATLILITIK